MYYIILRAVLILYLGLLNIIIGGMDSVEEEKIDSSFSE
jgi:hypothetical protein